ncbi:MAG: M23 family metallopeptidase [Clostridia bacterium]|nr:M23 family metallopeptidase [Clostridia bacterium]
MKEQNDNGKKNRLNGEKKFYLFAAIGCAAVLLAIIVVAVALNNGSAIENPVGGTSSVESSQGGTSAPEDSSSEDSSSDDKPVVIVPEGMILPVETVSVSNDYGFYYNQTLNSYYEHTGVDFTAEAGTEVFAIEDGVVESIYKEDVLTGTEITVTHADGLKSVYRFVTEAEGLKVGDSVKKGDVIATVAEANGEEYKDGAHLHLEILKEGKSVDPATYLTLEEK